MSDPEDRYVRTCPRHHVELREGEARGLESLRCPRGHRVTEWAVVDATTGERVGEGAASEAARPREGA